MRSYSALILIGAFLTGGSAQAAFGLHASPGTPTQGTSVHGAAFLPGAYLGPSSSGKVATPGSTAPAASLPAPAPAKPAAIPFDDNRIDPRTTGVIVGKVYRLYNSVSGVHMVSTNPEEKASAGFELEGGTFQTVASGLAGTAPLYRCFTGANHYVSADSACDGKRNDGSIGDVYIGPHPGAVPLYHAVKFTTGDHLITTDKSETTARGYELVQILGYVPR